jgi:DNA gyrase subunit A
MKLYAKHVLTDRSVIDPRDGLKPIHRRILWTMLQHKFLSNKMFVKSAKITGAVVGEYHPHGTSSVYDAMVKMAQDFYVNSVLVDSHGNFGNQYGDSAGAERYTEARLSKFAEDVLLDDVTDFSIDYDPNFDNSLKEPRALPAKIPLALINGTLGIAWGFAANIPTHNFSEVIEQAIKYVQDPTHQIVLLPDFPTGGIVCNKTEVEKGYLTGKSKVVIRAKIEKDVKRHRLIITEIPFMQDTESIRAGIQEAVKEKRILEIKNIKDLSTKGKVEIIVEVKKGQDLDVIENQLYADGKTKCQITRPFDLMGIVDGKFHKFSNVNEMVKEWHEFRVSTIRRMFVSQIKKHRNRILIIDGLNIALDPKNIDRVIHIVRYGEGRQSIINELMEEFNLKEKQAEHIVDMRLYKINTIEIESLVEEKKELESKVKELMEYFTSEDKVNKYIIDELKAIGKKYKQERKTIVTDISTNKDDILESTINDSNHTLIATTRYIKKLDDTIKIQKRGGKGLSLGNIKPDDRAIAIFNINNKDNLLMFTNSGKVYSRKGYEINSSELKNFGFRLASIIGDENLTNIMAITDKEMKNDNIKIAIGTKLNKIKLVSIKEFANIYKTGIIATKLNDGDSVIFAEKVDISKENSIIAATSSGSAINMSFDTIPESLRPTLGANIFDSSIMQRGDVISGIGLVTEETTHALFVTKKGLGKRVEISEFPTQIRGGKGRIGIKTKEGDEAVKLLTVNGEDVNLTVISNTNIISMNVSDTSVLLRPTFGNTIKKLNEGEEIIGATIVQ